MRCSVAVLSILLLVAAGVHAEPILDSRKPVKTPADYPPNRVDPDRQGGDTLLAATIIPDLPYEIAGTTTGYADDYDEICPYDTPGSPDVVYRFTPQQDRVIDVDMFGSTYDTKIYIYDDNLALIACNDDYYPDYTSKLEDLALAAGVAYYLVIDGYGGDHGEYQLSIQGDVPCRVIASCGAWMEDEPPLEDGYIDVYNGGCGSYGVSVSQVPYPDVYYGAEASGTLGWYLAPNGDQHRDTDWLQTIYPYEGGFEVEIEAQRPVILFWLSNTDCDTYEIEQYIEADACERRSMWIDGPGGDDLWLVVAPQSFDPPDSGAGEEFRYRLSLGLGLGGSCLDLGPHSDYTFGCQELLVDSYSTSFGTADLVGDVDLSEHCGGEPTPGGDVFVSVYLEAGDSIGISWYPYYIMNEPQRSSVCMALMTDMRPTSRSCEDVDCFSGYNDYGSVSTTKTGWHWLVIDDVSPGGSYEYGGLHFTRVEPPLPPPHDQCEGAAALPEGPFVIHDDLSCATNRFDPGRDGCPGAPDAAYTSRDVVYEVNLDRGQMLDVTMRGEGDWGEVLYLVRDCEEPVGACVAAGELKDGDRHLRYTALEDEQLWLVCDSHGVGPRAFTLEGSIDVTTDTPPPAPGTLAVSAAPNPFNPQTSIAFTVPQAGRVRVQVHALDGRLVRSLVDDERAAGRHHVAWDGRDGRGRGLASGAYVVRLKTAGGAASTRVLLLK